MSEPVTRDPLQRMSRRTGATCLSDLALDAIETGETSLADGSPERAHLEACSACSGRLAALQSLHAAFTADHNLGNLAADALQRAMQKPAPARSWMRFVLPLGFAASAAAVVFMVATPGFEPTDAKGMNLGLYVLHAETAGAPETGAPYTGEPLHPGDRVRFGLRSPVAGHVVVVGIDAARKVSVYFPKGNESVPVPAAAAETLLEGAVELDDTLGAETIVALRCDAPVSVSVVVEAALAAAGRLPREEDAALPSLGLPCVESRAVVVKTNPGAASPSAPAR